MPDSDFAAILCRAASRLFPSSNRHGLLRQENFAATEFRDWTHTLFFAPKYLSLEATNARIGLREQLAERTRRL